MPWQIRIYDREQTVLAVELAQPVELGRQSDEREKLYSQRQLDNPRRLRAVIAPLMENTVSRRHALLEPVGPNRLRLSNISTGSMVRLATGSELMPHHS